MTDEQTSTPCIACAESIAATQRQRTFRIYQTLFQQPLPVTVHLVSGEIVRADQLIAVDSSESKFVFKGVETQWGKSNRPVTIRGGDIASIKVKYSDLK